MNAYANLPVPRNIPCGKVVGNLFCNATLSPKVSTTPDNYGRRFWACQGTSDSRHEPFFRWADEKLVVPNLSLAPPPVLAAARVPQPYEVKCRHPSCNIVRVHKKCINASCAKHCREAGGCTLATHAPAVAQQLLVLPSTSSVYVPPLDPSLADDSTAAATPTTPNPSAGVLSQPALPNASEPARTGYRYTSQLRELFTTRQHEEEELRERKRKEDAARRDAHARLKNMVTVAAWVKDHEDPEEVSFQAGSEHDSQFDVTDQVLQALGLPHSPTALVKIWVPQRGLWRKIGQIPYTVTFNDNTRDILLCAADVTHCKNINTYIRSPLNPPSAHNIRDNLQAERKEVKKRLNTDFLERKRLPPRHFAPVYKAMTEGLIEQFESMTPLPPGPTRAPTPPAPVSDSEDEDIFLTPTRRLLPSTSLSTLPSNNTLVNLTASTPKTPAPTTTLRKRQLSPSPPLSGHPLSPNSVIDLTMSVTPRPVPPKKKARSSRCRNAGKKQWPADFHVCDVVEVFENVLSAPPTEREAIFKEMTGCPYKESTASNAQERWENIPVDVREAYVGCAYSPNALWSVLALTWKRPNHELILARQRERRLKKHAAKLEGAIFKSVRKALEQRGPSPTPSGDEFDFGYSSSDEH
ncbi:hypothetical protein MD484_g5124, partial [Candolleomyces efflorescens]